MKFLLRSMLSLVLIATAVPALALFGDKDPDEERKELQEARSNALAKLFKEKPGTREQLESAKGYAVFSNIGLNLGLVSTQRGGGILRNNRTGKDIYYKMFSAGGGYGLGTKFWSDEDLN